MLPGHSTIAQMTVFHRYLFPAWDTAWERQLLERFKLDPAARIAKTTYASSTPSNSGALFASDSYAAQYRSSNTSVTARDNYNYLG